MKPQKMIWIRARDSDVALLTAPLWLRGEKRYKTQSLLRVVPANKPDSRCTVRETSPGGSLALKFFIESSAFNLHSLLKITDRARLRDFDVGMPDGWCTAHRGPQQRGKRNDEVSALSRLGTALSGEPTRQTNS